MCLERIRRAPSTISIILKKISIDHSFYPDSDPHADSKRYQYEPRWSREIVIFYLIYIETLLQNAYWRHLATYNVKIG